MLKLSNIKKYRKHVFRYVLFKLRADMLSLSNRGDEVSLSFQGFSFFFFGAGGVVGPTII